MRPDQASLLAVVHPPAEITQWAMASALGAKAPVVVLNGVFNNGYKTLEMTYFLKPMTFNSRTCGYLMRCFPEDWTVFSADGGVVSARNVPNVYNDYFRVWGLQYYRPMVAWCVPEKPRSFACHASMKKLFMSSCLLTIHLQTLTVHM